MNTEWDIRHPITHHLKCWPDYFKAVKEGIKPFEIRKWDRPYAVGDTLVLEEWDPETADYTGDTITREVTYLLDLTYLPGDNTLNFDGYVALGMSNTTDSDDCAQHERENGCGCPCGEPDSDFCDICKTIRVDAIKEKLDRENPKALTLEEVKKRLRNPVYCAKSGFWGVVGFRRNPRKDYCIGFSYGWEWLDDVWRANEGQIYDNKPMEVR